MSYSNISICKQITGVDGMACGLIDDKFVVAGGGDDDLNIISDVQILDLDTLTWSSGPPMPEPVRFMSYVVYENNLLSIGGHNEFSYIGYGFIKASHRNQQTMYSS